MVIEMLTHVVNSGC